MSTPREIILQAMNLDRPSRTPLMCQLSIGHMLLQLGVSPVEFWHDPDIFSEGLCRLREIYTFDGVLVSLHGHDPEWRSAIQSRQSSPAGEEVTWRDGTKLRYLANDLPQPVIEEDAKSPSPKSMVDSLPESLDYIPVSQGLRFLIHPDHTFDVFLKVRTRLGENYSLHGEITSPFDYFLDAYGHQSGLMYLLTDPERSKEILGRYASLVEDLAVQMCATGVDAIKLSSPFAGAGFISPDLYCDFVLPFERQIAGAVRAEGVHIYTHTCGAISDRLELMLDAGVSGIECLDPAPLGDVELSDAKRRIGGRGFIKGNIDSVNTLLYGTKEAILEDARKRIEVGKEGGGFILSTACSVAPHVEREKLLLLREAVERWG
jgi:uroporphyrinogen-III decarboxylase